MRICIIPARGGSKRIHQKNIRDFKGKPIINWSIEAARNAECFERIVVSTDSMEIARIAKDAGADIPYLRPKELADDYTGTGEVIKHAIKALELSENCQICCLYATAPFVNSNEIKKGLEKLNESPNGTTVFTATRYSFPIQRAIRINEEGFSIPYEPKNISKRSQDLEECYHDAGQFYWATAETWEKENDCFDHGKPLILPNWQVQDIDNEEDWKRAEIMYKAMHYEQDRDETEKRTV